MRQQHPLLRVKAGAWSPGELIVAGAALIAFLVMGGGMFLLDWIGL